MKLIDPIVASESYSDTPTDDKFHVEVRFQRSRV